MSLKPEEVLVLPYYRRGTGEIEYAIFLRAGDCYWQGIAGGVEKKETPLQAAKREAHEEGGISSNARFTTLDSVTYFSVPVIKDDRCEEIFTVRQYTFAVEMKRRNLILSDEHTEYRWGRYNNATRLLKWDGDKLALKELRQKLTKNPGKNLSDQ